MGRWVDIGARPQCGFRPAAEPGDGRFFRDSGGAKLMVDAGVRLLSLANQLQSIGKRVALEFCREDTSAHDYLNRIGFFDALHPSVNVSRIGRAIRRRLTTMERTADWSRSLVFGPAQSTRRSRPDWRPRSSAPSATARAKTRSEQPRLHCSASSSATCTSTVERSSTATPFCRCTRTEIARGSPCPTVAMGCSTRCGPPCPRIIRGWWLGGHRTSDPRFSRRTLTPRQRARRWTQAMR